MPEPAAAPDRARAVVMVANPVAPYSRALRIGRALIAEGYSVEIAAIAGVGLPAVETIGALLIKRYVPSGRWAHLGRSSASQPVGERRPASRVARAMASIRRWLLWPHTVRGWWATLAREMEPADLYHACGSLTVAAALRARDRRPMGPSGRPARVIYDAIDDVFESNNVLDMPPPIRRWHQRRETGWARSADAVTSVNEELSARLGRRWRIAPPAVIPNFPDPPDFPIVGPDRPNLLRTELGISQASPIALFQGRLGPRLGLDEAAEAVLLVPGAVLVLLGFGRGFEAAQARDLEPRFLGRHRTLVARDPDELLAWTASADVAVVPLPPVSVNQRLSSPNKFWEALAAGTPVVLPAGLELMARLVRELDLGVVTPSNEPVELAGAIRRLLDEPLEMRAARRARIAAVARERFTWPVVEPTYRALVRDLRDGGEVGSPGAVGSPSAVGGEVGGPGGGS